MAEKIELSAEDWHIVGEAYEAYCGAYDAAPNGEGVAGAEEFGIKAVFFVLRHGMTAPQAVEAAIGAAGHYGVPRKYKLVPIET